MARHSAEFRGSSFPRAAALAAIGIVVACRSDSPSKPTSAVSTQPATLAGYLDREIQWEDDGPISQRYKELTGEDLHREKDNLGVTGVARFRSGDARFVLLRGQTSWVHPGYTYYEAVVFDGAWRKIARKLILAGYRQYTGGARVEHNEIVGCDLLVATACPFSGFLRDGESRPAEKGPAPKYVQYTGFSGGEFHLVRIENEAEAAIERSWDWSVPDMGPNPPKLTKDEWLRRLESKDIVVRLGALSWVTGEHKPSSEARHTGNNEESLEDALRYESVRDDPATQRILASLASDPNPWVRDYGKIWESQKQKK